MGPKTKILCGALSLMAFGGYALICMVLWWFQMPWESVRLNPESQPTDAVYFVYYPLGLSGEVSGISGNPKPCAPLDDRTDFIFRESGMRDFTFRFDDKGLHVFEGDSRPFTPLELGSFPVAVIRHDRHELPFEPSDPNFRSHGYMSVRLDYGATRCKSYWRTLVETPFEVWKILSARPRG